MIADKLTYLNDTKLAIKSAIEAKGQLVDAIPFRQYADKINAIQQGGEVIEGNGEFTVRFIDAVTGEIVKTHYVDNGEDAVPPTPLEHDYLTFDSFINSYTNVQNHVDVGIAYRVTDGSTRLFMNVNENFGMTDNLYLTKTDTSELTVFNETTNSIMAVTSANDNISIPLTFTQKGIQVLRIDSTANYSFNNYNIFGGTTRHKFDLIKCYIGSSVTSIGAIVFQNCYSLQSVVIPSSVTSIGVVSFQCCYLLKTVVIPSSVTSIDQNTFTACYSLISFVAPSSMTSISGHAFNICYSLKSVVIPSSMTSIESYMFRDLYSLQSIVIPNSVTSIGEHVFQNCYSLYSVVIPNSVTSIGENAFSSATGTYEIIMTSSVPPALLGEFVFSNTENYLKIYVPDASVNDYKAATNWVNFASKIYPISERL